MKISLKHIAPVFLLIGLSGCKTLEALDQALKNAQIDMPTPVTQAPISKPLSEICSQAEANPIRASDLYSNKTLMVSGEVQLITEHYQPRYNVYLKAGSVSIHAGSEDKARVAQLSVGQRTTVTGVIKYIDYDFNGCSITLREARF